MDIDEITSSMQRVLRMAEEFEEAPDIELANRLDKEISILRFMIGEAAFIPMHYFRRVHEDVVKYIDKQAKQKGKQDDN